MQKNKGGDGTGRGTKLYTGGEKGVAGQSYNSPAKTFSEVDAFAVPEA